MCKRIQITLCLLAIYAASCNAQSQTPPVNHNPGIQHRTQHGQSHAPNRISMRDQRQFRQINPPQQNSSAHFRNASFPASNRQNQVEQRTTAAFGTQNLPPVRQVGYTQDDPKVPDVLSGRRSGNSGNPKLEQGVGKNSNKANQLSAPANPPSHPPVTTNQNNPTANQHQSTIPLHDSSQTGHRQPPAQFDNTVPRQHDLANQVDANQLPLQSTLLTTKGPWIQASATGPKTLGVGKLANYEVILENHSNQPCNGALVGIDFPAWVEIGAATVTNGQKEITDRSKEARIIWQISEIPANSSQVMKLELTPRQAQMFDVSVEWTLIPLKAASSVQVTEPKLDIAVVGPNDVQFEQKVGYSVTIRNPGTGPAENVTIHLPEELGGESKNIGLLTAGDSKSFSIELIPRTAGPMEMVTTVSADGGLEKTNTQNIVVRRGKLEIQIQGPPKKYAGEMAVYNIAVLNTGDAVAKDVVMVMTEPVGTRYVSGIQGAEKVENAGIRWSVGTIAPGSQQQYKVIYQLNEAGQIKLDTAVQGTGKLVAENSTVTAVEAIADLVLNVEDPKGPLPTGQEVVYQIKIKNRGTKAASNVMLQMFFSAGMEPTGADGLKHKLLQGEVSFDPITSIQPGQEKVLTVTAKATTQGIHTFRAKLACREAESHDITEGTTKFYSSDHVNHNNTQLGNSQPPANTKPPVNVPKTGSLPPSSGFNPGGSFKR